ncbi:hypothetical protein [Mesorhizobium sp. SP-1A]|uniref:hypothetical protein n=1 Tax=Mesorhizobium sp. SP-1A TaxID=3077840 RepID=UPI0028F72247|nr:hypothetical protein [Mesorhizobium sp. SP-1A]
MSSSDFRHIAIRSESGKSDRLLRAAVSAFCSLPRPSRREISQLEDLALPLFDSASTESLRFVAAALCECEQAPVEVVRRLCEMTVDIAAPLLIRSKALADIDLIALIGRHGLPHARAIARRKGLNAAIANLIRVMEKPTLVRAQDIGGDKVVALDLSTPADANAGSAPTAEDVRRQLRAMMHARRDDRQSAANPAKGTGLYAKLRETALTGNAALLQTVLADTLGIGFPAAHALVSSADYAPLQTALRALGLGEDKAFLIAVAAFPALFPDPQAIRLFLDRYRMLKPDAAREQVRQWRDGSTSVAASMARQATANGDAPAPPPGAKAFKAS